MNKIKCINFSFFILSVQLGYSLILNIVLMLFSKFILKEDGELIVKITLVLFLISLIPSILVIINYKKNNIIITENEIIQNNVVLCYKSDIISITKVNILKTDIKYRSNNEEKIISITITNKKLSDIKTLLSIYD